MIISYPPNLDPQKKSGRGINTGYVSQTQGSQQTRVLGGSKEINEGVFVNA